MGQTHVTVTIKGLTTSEPAYEDQFLVNTDAIDCLVPAGKLAAAGVQVEGRGVYEPANGEVIEHAYGFARVSFMGSETVTQVIFGPEDAEPILGVVALENAGIGVDPVTRSFARMTAKPLK